MSYIGYVVHSLQYLGIIFSVILLADLPISIVAYALAWKYPAAAALWILVAGTSWWYLLSRGADYLARRYRKPSGVA